jgi:RNA polymerase sigma-70 factor (ECF subfamily)
MENANLSRSEVEQHVSNEAALVEEARHNPEAFAALYRCYLTPLYRYLYRRLSNVHDAEDLTTQVFIDVLEGLTTHRYQEGGCFVAYLFTIARRRLVDFYRKRPSAPLDDPPSPEPGLIFVIEKGQDMQRLACLLSRLDEDQQELLRLRFSAGLSFSEMSILDGRSEAAVKMAVYRTLDFLREHWKVENE